MIDLKLVQKQPEVLAKALADRQSPLKVDEFLELDGRRRALLAEVESLKQQQNATPTADDQMALLEKSYELAAKYMNGQDGQRGQIAQIPTAGQNGGGIGTPAIPVQAIRETTVSGLQQPMSDADFIRAYSQPRNYGFNTAVGTGYAMGSRLHTPRPNAGGRAGGETPVARTHAGGKYRCAEEYPCGGNGKGAGRTARHTGVLD